MLLCPDTSSIELEIKTLAVLTTPKDLQTEIDAHKRVLKQLEPDYEFIFLSNASILALSKRNKIKHKKVLRTDSVLVQSNTYNPGMQRTGYGTGGQLCRGATFDTLAALYKNSRILDAFMVLDKLLREG